MFLLKMLICLVGQCGIYTPPNTMGYDYFEPRPLKKKWVCYVQEEPSIKNINVSSNQQ